MFFSTARLVRNRESAIAALEAPVATPASTSRSRAERRESSEFLARIRASTRTSTTFGSTTQPPAPTPRLAPPRAPGRTLPDRLHQLDAVPDALLQQVGPSGRAVLEEFERVVRTDVLADHDDADLGMALP